jgi:hypothetical protein
MNSIELPPNFVVKRLIIEKLRFDYGIYIPKEVFSELSVEQLIDFETNGLKVLLSTLIPGKKIRSTVMSTVITYPSWWDHLKATVFSRWLRFKVNRVPVIIYHYHVCPHTVTESNEILHINFLEGENEKDANLGRPGGRKD